MQRPEPAELELIKFHVENKPDIPLDRPEQQVTFTLTPIRINIQKYG